jgi:superfamily I DNA/RNA helicase
MGKEDYFGIVQHSNSRAKVLDGGIKLQTVDSAKGLQYKAVIVLWTDSFYPYHSEEESIEKRRLYVALTRAEDFLLITHSSPNKFINDMQTSDDCIKIE